MATATRLRQAGRRGFHLRRCVPLALLSAVALTGCGQPPGTLFDPLEPLVAWPMPPEQPRIRYVGQIESDRDLKPGVSFGESLGRTLFGAPPVRTMLSPYALCSDAAGERLFVCDSNAQVLHVFNLQTREYQTWQPGETERFAQPVGVTVGPDERILVCDSVAGAIHVFDPAGVHIGLFTAVPFERPSGLAWDAGRERLFVSDTAAHQIVVLSAVGDEIARIGGRGIELGRFNFPTDLAVDDAGWLYVSDTLNFRVQVFGPDLEPIRRIGRKGDLPGYFSQPKGIALDGEGHIYVVDAHFEAVQIFNRDGQFLLPFGEEGTGPGQFWLPAGIHIDQNNRIWIADTYNRRVQVFQYLPEAAP